jgi:hypothetical protein
VRKRQETESNPNAHQSHSYKEISTDNETPRPPTSPVTTYQTDRDHKQQKSPDTEITAPQQGGLTHHIPTEPSATNRERQPTRPLHATLERNPKRARESDGKHEEPNTTATPQGHSPDVGGGGAASLTTAIEEERNMQTAVAFGAIVQTTHGLQTRARTTDEVQRHKSLTIPPRQAIYDDLIRRDTIAPRTEPGTPPGQRQQAVAFLERNPQRVRGSDGEYEEPITTAVSQEDIGTLAENDYHPIFGIRVGRDTFALTTEPGTPSTGQRALGIQVGRDTFAHTPVTGIPQVYRPQAVAYVPESTTNPAASSKKKKRSGTKKAHRIQKTYKGGVAVAGRSLAWACSGCGAAICVRIFSSVSHV